MKCRVCFKQITDDFSHLLKYDNDFRTGRKAQARIDIEMDEGYGLHKECAEKVIMEEKVSYYKKALEPIFQKLNRSQFREVDMKAIVAAFCCEHRFLQNEAIILIKSIIETLGKKSGDPAWEDGRNSYGLAWCKKVSDL